MSPGVPPELVGPPGGIGADSPVAALGVPTRSQIVGYTAVINELWDSASAWRGTAEQLEISADRYFEQMSKPGGTDWDGEARETAVESARADRGVVWQATEHARDMAGVAERGASNMSQTRINALEAIEEAENDEFAVGEDLAVTDRRTYSSYQMSTYQARQAKAAEHESDIVWHARVLKGEHAEVDAKLHAGAAKLNGMIPKDWNSGAKPADYRTWKQEPPRPHNGIQAAGDGTWKQEPPPPPVPPVPPVNPFAGWTEEQMAQVATEIAHGHALKNFPGMTPPEPGQVDLRRDERPQNSYRYQHRFRRISAAAQRRNRHFHQSKGRGLWNRLRA